MVEYGLQGRVALISGINNVEDIADAVLFLVSDRASMITGQVVRVAGGHTV